MKKRPDKKISLNRETLQNLNARQNGQVAGGSWWSCWNSCVLECYFSEPMNEAGC